MSDSELPPESDEEPTRPLIKNAELLATRVLVFWEGGQSSHFLAPNRELTIGRQDDCDVVIALPSVSRRHARIAWGESSTVLDLGGMNGVRVRGELIPRGEPVPIFQGDVIEIGGAVVVVQGSAAPRTVPPPQPVSLEEEPMQAVERLISLVAPSDIGVLLLGETGVGKTIAAKEIHARSRHARGPFVRINCAALPETLLESELFGYERGAFTGATVQKPGLFETAAGGSVLLDEVGEMPLVTQAKLLTVLETREVTRLGSVRARPVDIRFIAATNADLFARAQAGTFRADLYYRLNGISIVIPPLRERRSEIEAFARRFLADACKRSGRNESELSGEALSILLRYPFPGNLRELRNTMDRAAVLADGGAVHAEHLLFEPTRALVMTTPSNAWAPGAFGPPAIQIPPPPPSSRSALTQPPDPPLPREAPPQPSRGGPLRDQMDAFERERIVSALAANNGNQTRAAAALGMSRRALVTRIEQYRLPRPRKR